MQGLERRVSEAEQGTDQHVRYIGVPLSCSVLIARQTVEGITYKFIWNDYATN